MFCSNCGEKINNNVRFCPECGSTLSADSINTNDIQSKESIQTEASEIGIYVDENSETLQQIAEKICKNKKRWKIIRIVLESLYMWMMIKGIINLVVPVLEGKKDVWFLVQSTASMILITCGLVYVFFEIYLRIISAKKAIYAGEYLKVIHVDDRQVLMKSIDEMNCSVIKKTYMDENGNPCVIGKKSKHTFAIENGVLVLSSDKDNYKTNLEKETIAGNLLKHLFPYASVNAFETERTNRRLPRINLLLAILASISGLIIMFTILISSMAEENHKYIQSVKDGRPTAYPNVTYGEAFDAFFKDGKWKYFISTDEQDVVEFSGVCLYGNKEAKILMQFLISDDKKTVETGAFSIDGKSQTELVTSLFLLKVFESYGTKSDAPQLEDIFEDEIDYGDNDMNFSENDKEQIGNENPVSSDMEINMNEWDTQKFNLEDLEGTYNRMIGPACELSIWTVDEDGISFAIGIGSSGYLAYVDRRDLTAKWTEDGTAVFSEEGYELTFIFFEDGNLTLRENHPYDLDFSLAGDYIPKNIAEETCDFVFPDSNVSSILVSELEGKTAAECKIARNEIYARHGRRFNDEQLQAYFDTCMWYTGTTDAEDFSDSLLTKTEKSNIRIIAEYEARMGY